MYKGQSILAIVPARGGSKGVPGKNLKKIGRTSLVARAMNVALGSKYIDRLVVSSDSKEIIQLANKLGSYAPFKRPGSLAKDKTPSLPVFQHALQWAEQEDKRVYQYVVVLEPTCPFRLPKHVDEAIELIHSTQASSVMSLIQVGDHHPVRIKKLTRDGKISPFAIPEPEGLRRQDQEPAFIRNGAVYAYQRNTLVNDRLWGDTPYGFEMDEKIYGINIDTPLDLLLANEYYKQMVRAKKNNLLEPIKKKR